MHQSISPQTFQQRLSTIKAPTETVVLNFESYPGFSTTTLFAQLSEFYRVLQVKRKKSVLWCWHETSTNHYGAILALKRTVNSIPTLIVLVIDPKPFSLIMRNFLDVFSSFLRMRNINLIIKDVLFESRPSNVDIAVSFLEMLSQLFSHDVISHYSNFTPTPFDLRLDKSEYYDDQINELVMKSWKWLFESCRRKGGVDSAEKSAIFPLESLSFYSQSTARLNWNTAWEPRFDADEERQKISHQYKTVDPTYCERRIESFDLIVIPLLIKAKDTPDILSSYNHYALAVLRKRADGWYEYFYECPLGEDAFYRHNQQEAYKIFRTLMSLKGYTLLDSNTTMARQQENGYDCGVWAVINIEYILHKRIFPPQWPHGLDIQNIRRRHKEFLERGVEYVVASDPTMT
jgi:hypothetical protein